MSLEDLKKTLEDAREKVSLKNLTSMHVGGAAELFYTANSQEELKNAVSLAWKNNVKVLILGEGSNVIISDFGFPGFVIQNFSKKVIIGSSEVIADSGIPIRHLIKHLMEKDLGGLEFLAGIPGTLGGAIYGNAGAFGKVISDITTSITILDIDEKVRSLKARQLEFGYRTSIFKKNQDLRDERKPVILNATLKVNPIRKQIVLRTIENYLKIRSKKQPKAYSAGCFFKNLKAVNYPNLSSQAKLASIGGKISSGALLERVGAKESRIGGIRVAKEHANYITNNGGGTAYEIKQLAEDLKKKVYSEFGVTLEEEVEFVGDFKNPPRRSFLKLFSS